MVLAFKGMDLGSIMTLKYMVDASVSKSVKTILTVIPRQSAIKIKKALTERRVIYLAGRRKFLRRTTKAFEEDMLSAQESNILSLNDVREDFQGNEKVGDFVCAPWKILLLLCFRTAKTARKANGGPG